MQYRRRPCRSCVLSLLMANVNVEMRRRARGRGAKPQQCFRRGYPHCHFFQKDLRQELLDRRPQFRATLHVCALLGCFLMMDGVFGLAHWRRGCSGSGCREWGDRRRPYERVAGLHCVELAVTISRISSRSRKWHTYMTCAIRIICEATERRCAFARCSGQVCDSECCERRRCITIE